MNWANELFLSFDTETTGLDPIRDRMCEIGCAVFDRGEYVHGFNWLIKSDRIIEPHVTAINNITPEMIEAEGKPEAEVVQRVCHLFHQVSEARRPILAFNAIFDLRFMFASAARLGIRLSTDHMRVIDPLVIDRKCDPYKRGKRTLEVQAPRYGISPGGHRALADAIVAGKVAIAQCQRWSWIGRTQTTTLHRNQARWYFDWITNYRRWQETQGVMPLAEIQTWPYGGLDQTPDFIQEEIPNAIA